LLNKQQDEEEDPIKQYEFSKSIAEVVDIFTAFDSIYAYDHFLSYYAADDKNSFFECFTLLSAITNRVKVGQVVTCNSYRNPALLAKMLSTLDIISNGTGWHKDEYLQYGYDFPSACILNILF
jgi:alkanesulfonate monooxygenase SsuD/methylene tetrahydromethanopterin reductase-like flavin-dependent oxidoreductase (luciferase family)